MSRAQVMEYLNNHPSIIDQHIPEVIDAFAVKMKNYQYGPQETRQAFFMFRDGFDAGMVYQQQKGNI